MKTLNSLLIASIGLVGCVPGIKLEEIGSHGQNIEEIKPKDCKFYEEKIIKYEDGRTLIIRSCYIQKYSKTE